ncbi:hypothetical protein CEUSTIGMA_g5609.t1 [Chlamydomonas eustigma]|uniref:Uncharacterized protein n=1 Tax=Chlamydomonas eustigma TaxID=1157962 RepID=A0A250X4Z9_9CHLO|nr:hypothetical protein CEUSTIGMA_g5609.t1 [Chlamydomonas eustigma]|eukprot:GAX78167.1 hypothetical protein CEUSTIGMA_g5609.t1 [Chlamydomonas eustigma]
MQDLTETLKKSLNLANACLFNPGLVNLSDRQGTFIMSIRAYWSKFRNKPCIRSKDAGGPWSEEWWSGTNGYVLAVLRRPLSGGSIVVLSHKVIRKTNMEDVRLFRDDRGKIRMMFNRGFGDHETGHTKVQVAELRISGPSFELSIGPEQSLIFLGQQRLEKNWVPWEGTSLMTYTNYPFFAPHTVMDWVDYDKPRVQLKPVANSPAPFFEKVFRDRGGWIRFSGGTPAVRLDKERFVAVGHAVGDLSCFHKKIPEQPIKRKLNQHLSKELGMKTVLRRGRSAIEYNKHSDGLAENINMVEHSCNSSTPAPGNGREWWDHLKYSHDIPQHHQFWEYFFFLYAWSVEPPYQITHISHAFIPFDAEDHSGVVFPTGLQLLRHNKPEEYGPSLGISYGKSDHSVMMMTLSAATVKEYLQPTHGANNNPLHYKFCALDSTVPIMSHSEGAFQSSGLSGSSLVT